MTAYRLRISDWSADVCSSDLATVTAAPSGEAIVTARAGGAVTRLFKRLGDPVRAGETIAIVQSRDAAQIAAERVAADARSTLAQKRSEEHTSELQSLMRNSYAVFCLTKKKHTYKDEKQT